MMYSFDEPTPLSDATTQYFEMFCNRGIYHQGWTAVTRHSTPWVVEAAPAVRRRRLGALRRQATGARLITWPGNAREARGASGALALEAESTTCCPLDDRRVERFNSDIAGRPG